MARALVAYFSASGRTRGLSERLARAVGADLFEIVPDERYTSADLDWRNRHSRSTIEMADRTCRPEIATRVHKMASYNIVFVGFPIWWYREPSIIDTFMEAYDLADKTIVPFATSGGSDIGSVSQNIAALAPGARVEWGQRFSSSASERDLRQWAKHWVG